MKKPDTLTLFVVFTTFIFAAPLFALLSAAIYAKVWDMLLAKQYGEGPTYQSWYGISVLVTFGTMYLQKRDKSEDNKSEDAKTGIARTIGGIVGTYVGMGAVLLLIMFVCFALGWSR